MITPEKSFSFRANKLLVSLKSKWIQRKPQWLTTTRKKMLDELFGIAVTHVGYIFKGILCFAYFSLAFKVSNITVIPKYGRDQAHITPKVYYLFPKSASFDNRITNAVRFTDYYSTNHLVVDGTLLKHCSGYNVSWTWKIRALLITVSDGEVSVE